MINFTNPVTGNFMKFWVGVTDNRWFEFLRDKSFDEVNFWQPSAKPLFTNIESGTPFFFKLKKPYNHIGGFGTYVSYTQLPMSIAWETFGQKNGAANFQEFSGIIRSLARNQGSNDPGIGCTLLSNPTFFSTENLKPIPDDWASNIVRGKSYLSESLQGNRLLATIPTTNYEEAEHQVVNEPGAGYSLPFLSRTRLGQGTFRALVTSVYKRRCAVTGENILPVLEAAHIQPFAQNGPHKISNGMLLRSDFHKLFDLGYITVTKDLKVEVSRKIHQEWFNGKAYYRLHGESLHVVPDDPSLRPGPSFLEWHNQHVFKA